MHGIWKDKQDEEKTLTSNGRIRHATMTQRINKTRKVVKMEMNQMRNSINDLFRSRLSS